METKAVTSMWWLKNTYKQSNNEINTPSADVSSSLAEYLKKEQDILSNQEDEGDVDVGSIIEEINRVAAQSPLGPYEKSVGDRSVEDLMKEAEKIFIESSKSFEQLSQRSKTSQNISDLTLSDSKASTPTPRSVSPLPMDSEHHTENDNSYSDDFSDFSKTESGSPVQQGGVQNAEQADAKKETQVVVDSKEVSAKEFLNEKSASNRKTSGSDEQTSIKEENKLEESVEKQISLKNNVIRELEVSNRELKSDLILIKKELQQTKFLLDQSRSQVKMKNITTPEMSLELEKALEQLKDTKEIKTSLQLQLDGLNKTHQLLKSSHEELLASNKNLERKICELDNTLTKYKNELLNIQRHRDKLLENEISLNKLLDIEKLQTKSLKLQNEKDAKCIKDLNRQIKEMERIIARKHPDSVSALIVAAKNDATDFNMTARKVLEDRIRILEEEAQLKDTESTKVYLEIQEKFNQMKLKYESHIEDLELHVSDLKAQLKSKKDTYDMYTQTQNCESVEKDSQNATTQTDVIPIKPPKIIPVKRNDKVCEGKEETHLLATIRGLKADLSNKEKVISKLQREIDELKKTNKKLQKEREGSLKSLSDRREFRSYPEKLALQARGSEISDAEDELRLIKIERDKLRTQLCRMEEDYHILKSKRLQDLNTLQEAHEKEMSSCLTDINSLREQLEVHQVTIRTLQTELGAAKEELAIVSVERDHLNNMVSTGSVPPSCHRIVHPDNDVDSLRKKVAFLEKRYEEREHRLRAIVHGLAQRNITNRTCEQCAERQQQLISYKNELDQLLATLKAIQ